MYAARVRQSRYFRAVTDVTGRHGNGCDELNILAHVDIDIREFDEGQAEEHGLLNGDLYLGRDRGSDLNPNCYGTHVWRQQKGPGHAGRNTRRATRAGNTAVIPVIRTPRP